MLEQKYRWNVSVVNFIYALKSYRYVRALARCSISDELLFYTADTITPCLPRPADVKRAELSLTAKITVVEYLKSAAM